MDYPNQDDLPGGTIGEPKTVGNIRVWSDGTAGEEPDPRLQRTTVRWNGNTPGWYLIRHDENGRPVRRSGPWPQVNGVEDALREENDEGEDTNDNAGDEDQIERLMKEGLAARVYEAAGRLVQAVGAAEKREAVTRRRWASSTEFHAALDTTGATETATDPETETARRSAREAWADVLEATERWRIRKEW